MAIDVSALRLQKGVTVPDGMVAALSGVPAGPGDDFKLARLQVKLAVERRLYAAGLVWTVKVAPDGVRVLTDAEAVRHNAKLHRMGRRKIRRAARQAAGVDVSQLDGHDRLLLDTERRRLAQAVSALDRAMMARDPAALARPAKTTR